MSLPHIAIIGRANVGKSTLFNRITRTRSAIVNNTPGVTRDRIYGLAEWNDRNFMVIDTGGVDLDGVNTMDMRVKEQGELAVREADSIVFVVDGQHGLTPQDREVIDQVRKSGKPLFLAVNKIDDPQHDDRIAEFYALGVENTIGVSAEHNIGISGLLDEVVASLPEKVGSEDETSKGIRVAVIGRPNAGKSSIINAIMDEDRCIVSATPGTTRDAVDSALTYEDQDYTLVDTAGIRRKGKTKELLDKFSVIMALKALERCDIAVLVIDAEKGVTDQDATIAGYALDQGRGCLIMVNKWDLIDVSETSLEDYVEQIRYKLKFVEFAPIIMSSARTGYGLSEFFPAVKKVFGEYSKRISTGKLNDCFTRAIQKNPMSSYRGKFLKIYYSTQIKSCPPTFQCFVNYPEGIHFSYRRYLVNSLRHTFGLEGTPIRLIFSDRHSQAGN